MLKFLLILLLVAVAIYLTVRLTDQRRASKRGTGRAPRPRRQEPPRMVAPDDDPEFLRDLERKRRQKDEPEPPA